MIRQRRIVVQITLDDVDEGALPEMKVEGAARKESHDRRVATGKVRGLR